MGFATLAIIAFLVFLVIVLFNYMNQPQPQLKELPVHQLKDIRLNETHPPVGKQLSPVNYNTNKSNIDRYFPAIKNEVPLDYFDKPYNVGDIPPVKQESTALPFNTVCPMYFSKSHPI